MITKVNFQKIINDLTESGMTYQKIADDSGTSKAVIYAIAKGNTKEPRFNLGVRIMEVWKNNRQVPT